MIHCHWYEGKLEVYWLTHWSRVTRICVRKLTSIGSANGLSSDRRQAIIWTNGGMLLIGPLVANFSEILIEILAFSFTKIRLKVSFAKWRPWYLGLNVLNRPSFFFTAGHCKAGTVYIIVGAYCSFWYTILKPRIGCLVCFHSCYSPVCLWDWGMVPWWRMYLKMDKVRNKSSRSGSLPLVYRFAVDG